MSPLIKSFGGESRERAVDYLNSLDKAHLLAFNYKHIPTEELENFSTPDFTIYNAGQFRCNRYTHYMTSSTSVDINLARKEMIILGAIYAGEMKKGLFSLIHYLMPKQHILSLHSGCNMGKDGDVALFFGLSGTRKTTLSTDHNRYLIGDDEHCWSENGVSNTEGGCYAKCIDLSRERALHLECHQVWLWWIDPHLQLLIPQTSKLSCVCSGCREFSSSVSLFSTFPTQKIPCVGPHPKNVILLPCDAFGVFPPQWLYCPGNVAGTEEGVKEPRATFSACFGAAFLMLHPTKYAAMLAEKMQKHGATAWLAKLGIAVGLYMIEIIVNDVVRDITRRLTPKRAADDISLYFVPGSYGSGSRIKLAYTRQISDDIHYGKQTTRKLKIQTRDPHRG
ncbi:putative phosphoenolpyruvate carboxykinase (ATP) [Rosa chinensis]|uniref:phosphoenolpyruvate carboxykinase (ATP) n=1 Tax=Rosa chinensis TaxID=74649 RepID=A0A2P6RPI3_ROSCH|nr:putative phosphoenolpyruvate carboxykinase (ATP) [Rosa chinensis]